MAKRIKTKETRLTNPNGVNQYTPPDPRQKLTWELYVDPKSETFANAYRSAMKAGYTEGTSAQITTENWFSDKLRRMNLLSKAEKALDEVLDLPNQVQAMGAFGPIYEGKGNDKKAVMTHATSLLKIKADVAKFVAETQGKKDGYSKQDTFGGNANLLQAVINIVMPKQDETKGD